MIKSMFHVCAHYCDCTHVYSSWQLGTGCGNQFQETFGDISFLGVQVGVWQGAQGRSSVVRLGGSRWAVAWNPLEWLNPMNLWHWEFVAFKLYDDDQLKMMMMKINNEL